MGNFAGDFGESGFQTEFQDGYLYEQYWGGQTDQVGHFLTAVGGGYGVGKGALPEDITLGAFIGHEKTGDQNLLEQLSAASDADFGLFHQAVNADAAGDYELRDRYLMTILGPGSLADRKGNSLEDLRLTVRGWRFGQMIANGDIETRDEAADWLKENVAK